MAMSKTLRITKAPEMDFGIAFGDASAKDQHAENGSHAVTFSCLGLAPSLLLLTIKSRSV
jgi:hypothetical protein